MDKLEQSWWTFHSRMRDTASFLSTSSSSSVQLRNDVVASSTRIGRDYPGHSRISGPFVQ